MQTIDNGLGRIIEVRENGMSLHLKDFDNCDREIFISFGTDLRKELIKAFAKESEIDLVELAEDLIYERQVEASLIKKHYYKLPQVLQEDQGISYLNIPRKAFREGITVEFANKLYTDYWQTQFTEKEFQEILREYPELQVLIPMDIPEAEKEVLV